MKRIRHDDYPHLRFAFRESRDLVTDPTYHVVDERLGDDYTMCRKPVSVIIRNTETEYDWPICQICWEKAGEGKP